MKPFDFEAGSWAPNPSLWKAFQGNMRAFAPPAASTQRRGGRIEGLQHAPSPEVSCVNCEHGEGGICEMYEIPALDVLSCSHWESVKTEEAQRRLEYREVPDFQRAARAFLSQRPRTTPIGEDVFALAVSGWLDSNSDVDFNVFGG